MVSHLSLYHCHITLFFLLITYCNSGYCFILTMSFISSVYLPYRGKQHLTSPVAALNVTPVKSMSNALTAGNRKPRSQPKGFGLIPTAKVFLLPLFPPSKHLKIRLMPPLNHCNLQPLLLMEGAPGVLIAQTYRP